MGRSSTADLCLTLAALLAASVVASGALTAIAEDGVEAPVTHRVLVIPVNLPGRAPLSLDRKQLAQALYGPAESVASRYRAISYGKVNFAGSEADVADPVTLSEPADFCNTGLKRLADAAEGEASRRCIVPASYQHVVLVLPKDVPCWWTGLGGIGGDRVWVKATTAKALEHELGHNLGMDHAVRWRSSDADASDFMGSGGASLNAPHVIEMGWLRGFPGKVVEVTRATDVTLEAFESDPHRSTLPKVAIVRPASDANTYYLSYRASSSVNPLSDEFTGGVNLHVFDQARRTGGLTYFVESLSDGTAYNDGPLIIRQLSHTEGGSVTVRISFAGTGKPMPVGPPAAPPGTVQSLASGKCLDLPRGQTADGTPAIQYDCHGSTNQQWTLKPDGEAGSRIISRLSGKCLGFDPTSAAAGGHTVQLPCGSSPAQLWTIETATNGYVLRNLANGLCLDVPGGSTANGAEPIAWACHGGTNQTWRYVAPAAP